MKSITPEQVKILDEFHIRPYRPGTWALDAEVFFNILDYEIQLQDTPEQLRELIMQRIKMAIKPRN